MGLFDAKGEPVFLKEDSFAERELEAAHSHAWATQGQAVLGMQQLPSLPWRHQRGLITSS